jgi:hypothetical protein
LNILLDYIILFICIFDYINIFLFFYLYIGGDPVLLAKSSMIQSSLDTKMNKASYDKKAGGGGMLSVTADVSIIMDLVNESSEIHGDN